jgi:flavodoxin
MIRKVIGIYYSPAGGTEMMTETLARKLGAILDDCSPLDVSVECYDMFREDSSSIAFDDETVAVIGMPVYVGKIPLPAARAMHNIAGNGAMTLAAVSYGGRKYGNALFELKRLAEECGFKAIGAGAFMVSYMARRGSSRSAVPAIDNEAIADFSKAASEKIKRLAGCEIEELRIKPMPVEVNGRMPVHKISRISPKAAAVAQGVFNKMSVLRRRSEWFL